MTNQVEYLDNPKETVAPSSEEMQRIAGYRKNNLWSDLRKHLTYQLQETIEQVTAFNQRNEEDFRDASGDIRVLLDAQKASVTYSLDEDYNEIVTKLFTRLDDTKEGAERTQQKYANLGVATYIVFDERTGQYINRVLETCDGTDGEHYPKDKWLKSYKYQTPVFELVGLKESDSAIGAGQISIVKNAGTLMIIGSEDDIIIEAQRILWERRREATLAQNSTTYVELDATQDKSQIEQALTEAMAGEKNSHHLMNINQKVAEVVPVADKENTYRCKASLEVNEMAILNLMGSLSSSGKVLGLTDSIETADVIAVSPDVQTDSELSAVFKPQFGYMDIRNLSGKKLEVEIEFVMSTPADQN